MLSCDKKIKILHVGEYVQGGVATYLNTILDDDNYRIDNYIVLSNEKSSHSWRLSSNKVFYYNYKRGLFGVLKATFVINKIIREIDPDVVYCHSTWAGVFGRVARVLSQKNAKVIYNAHGWAFLMDAPAWKKTIYAYVERCLSLLTDRIINVSKYEYNAALKYGLKKDKQCILYSGSELPNDDVEDISDMLSDADIIMLFVGRFDTPKGVDYLLDVFRRYNKSNIHLYLIGGSVISSNDYHCVNNERITFIGWLPHEKVAEYYKFCDVVIMPSRWEAFGLVAIEAMKYKKPVIVSNRGALPELVKNDVNGYVFDMDDDTSLLNILEKLDKEELATLGKRGYDEYIRKYTADKMRLDTKNIYMELLEENI